MPTIYKPGEIAFAVFLGVLMLIGVLISIHFDESC